MVMVALGKARGQGGGLGLQVAEAQRQGEGECESGRDGEGGGQQEEEDEEEAGDEGRRLNGEEVLCALRQEAHLRQVGEGDVAVLVQDGRHVRQVQGERKERAAAPDAAASGAAHLLQPLLAGREQQRLLVQQRCAALSDGLTAATAGTAASLGGANGGGPLVRALPAPPPHFGGWDGGWGEGELRVYRGGELIGGDDDVVCGCVCVSFWKEERKGTWVNAHGHTHTHTQVQCWGQRKDKKRKAN